ncbi:hypothetical protein [Halobaculum rubrum]|uniref:hypothetical protein n=1 Tax=Halobaculum rubrum TaxID=2872158 RepID=UPI001CA3B4A4|nr:hypothetical protein [Halobaculum rubrum]QZX98728.1 hypothetical protein K6T25_10630 [Halobaculum rubrum]
MADDTPTWSVIAPDWVQNLSELGKALSNGNFASLVRSVVFRPIVKTIIGIAATVYGAILTLFQGSAPGFSRDESVWGLADLFPAIASYALDLVEYVYGAYVDVGLFVASAITPSVPGPIDGLILLVVFAVEAVVTMFLIVRGTRAVADAIPGLSGIETFIFG